MAVCINENHTFQNLVIIASYDLLKQVENMEEYSIKFSHKYYTYPRTFGKELGKSPSHLVADYQHFLI